MLESIMLKRVVAFVLFMGCILSAPVFSHGLPSFTKLIEKASPSVVQIDTAQRSANQSSSGFPKHDIPEIFGERFRQRQEESHDALSAGTGFIISSDGYVLTNHHVVDGADDIVIRLSDRREFQAKIVGVDRRSDLALLKINASGLPAAEFADVSQLKVGEWVLAIGSPFGLDYSASAGIISAIGRSIPTDTGDNYVPFIQSDVALNPGNSGGPLLNLEGKVVGINSLIFSRSGGSIGLSFAIPANVALKVVEQLKSKGYVERGWLGVYIQDVDKNLATSFGLEKPVGALVAQVEAGSPADKAGLRPGDVVLKLNGQDIVDSGDLPHVIGLVAPGETITAEVIQQGKARQLDIVIGTLPKISVQVESLIKPDRLGLIISKIVDDGLGSWRTGVLVEQVVADSVADKAGLFKGDVIMQLGYHSIDNPNEYDKTVKNLPVGEPVAIRLVRQGRSIFKTLQIGH
jgi:serine protease Do